MDSSPKTRFSLIEKIKDPGDAEAWSEFTAIYYPLVFEICRKKGLQHADATDITQEVLSRVADAVEKYDSDRPGATFRGWLYRITRNLTVDFFRRRAKDPLANAALTSDWNEIREPSSAEDREFLFEFRKHMFAVVAKTVQANVSPKAWAVFWKTEIEGVDVQAAAEELQMSHGALYVAKSRVIAKLKEEVQKRMNEASRYSMNEQGS